VSLTSLSNWDLSLSSLACSVRSRESNGVQKALMTGRDVICRDAPRVLDVDDDANEVGRRWTGRAEETRLREGDVRHAVGCAM
jgi:hypothetical protein